MSKSVKRVLAAAENLGLDIELVRTAESTRTAVEAAQYVGCEVDQIGKSILIAGATSGALHLFLTPGSRLVDLSAAAEIMDEEAAKADAARVRAVTGFAIGGVSPIGHLHPIPIWTCTELLMHRVIWVAAGTPHHLFEICPKKLAEKINAQPRQYLQQI